MAMQTWQCVWWIVLISSLNAFHQRSLYRSGPLMHLFRGNIISKGSFPRLSTELFCISSDEIGLGLSDGPFDEFDVSDLKLLEVMVPASEYDKEEGDDENEDGEHDDDDANEDTDQLYDDDDDNEQSLILQQHHELEQPSMYIKPTIPLTPGTPIEFFQNGTLYFGNYAGPRDSPHSIDVTTSAGTSVRVSIGNIITAWDSLTDSPPQTIESWAEIMNDAMYILRSLPTRMVDLEELWQVLFPLRATFPRLDSSDVAHYLFYERDFRAWIKNGIHLPRKRMVFTAAQRYAAAILLQSDVIHFKRKESSRIWLEDWLAMRHQQQTETSAQTEQSVDRRAPLVLDPKTDPLTVNLIQLGDAAVFLTAGGFAILDESVSNYLQSEYFVQYYHEKTQIKANDTNNEQKQHNHNHALLKEACINKILHQLELYALSTDAMEVRPNPLIKKVMKVLMNHTAAAWHPDVAKKLLMHLHHGTTDEQKGGKEEDDYQQMFDKRARFVEQLTSGRMLHNADQLQQETNQLMEEVKTLHEYYQSKKVPIVKRVGKYNQICGRFDYRNHSQHPVICVDQKHSVFLDDAFSYDPETHQVFIHIVDMMQHLRKYPALSQLAQERMKSVYFPSSNGKKEAYHVLPPQVLQALTLSTTECNEVLTVALKLDPITNKIIKKRIFAAVIGPVHALSIQDVDEMVAQTAEAEEAADNNNKEEDKLNMLYGIPNMAIKRVSQLSQIATDFIQEEPWIAAMTPGQARRQQAYAGSNNNNNNVYSPAKQMINTFLTMYSNVTVGYCKEKHLLTPIVWENAEDANAQLFRRFGTQPLRNFMAQLQQQQIRVALGQEVKSTLTLHTLREYLRLYKRKKQELSQLFLHQHHHTAQGNAWNRN